MNRTFKDYAMLSLKGMAMGAADVVPGVSGGTIAFIVGIYDELLESIKGITPKNIKLLFSGKLKAFWEAINGNFLVALLLGIMFSVLSLARLVTYLLETHPILIWSFFFGLVVASVWCVCKDITEFNWKIVVGFIIGAVVAYWITIATPAETPNALWFIFLSGAIAICAMILPGISGSFILVLLGKYHYIMTAIKEMNLLVLIVFAIGCTLGITTFSHALSYALHRFRNVTFAVVGGFMLGSLNKVWPWKTIIGNNTAGGEIVPIERNIMPNEFIVEGIILMIVGFFVVYVLERMSSKKG